MATGLFFENHFTWNLSFWIWESDTAELSFEIWYCTKYDWLDLLIQRLSKSVKPVYSFHLRTTLLSALLRNFYFYIETYQPFSYTCSAFSTMEPNQNIKELKEFNYAMYNFIILPIRRSVKDLTDLFKKIGADNLPTNGSIYTRQKFTRTIIAIMIRCTHSGGEW